MELVPGEDLSQRIARGAILFDEALPIAKQIAEALEAAHEQGIVHRDLKPANIRIAPGGVVKLLDFGIAKAVAGDGAASDAPTVTVAGTRDGVILGTAAFMSPEQARGQPVDRRTDIWAFGCVLYEMLTGRVAFPGDTLSDTIVSVLEHEPDWQALEAVTPTNVQRVLWRCLVKDPKRRLRDIGDARLELEPPNVIDEERRTPPPRRTRRWMVIGAAAVVIVVGAFGWRTRGGVPPALENPLANARFTRLTDFEGVDRDAAISPDGKFVAFLSNRDGPFDILLTQVGSGRFNNLTQGKESDLDSALPTVGFAADGTELWFHDADLMAPLRTLPLMGGPPRVFLGKSPVKTPPMNAAWSPDGTQLVYHTSDPGDPMFAADRAGASPRLIFSAETAGIHHHWPAWSPDSRWIYFSRGNPLTSEFDLYRIPASGGRGERMTYHNRYVASPAPIGPNAVLYIARGQDDSGPWLWMLDINRKATRRVSFGLEQYTSVKASEDGQRLVATVENPTASLWTVPIVEGVAEEHHARRLALPTVRALAPRFGGTSLFYLSALGSGDGLWRLDNGQAVEVWKGSDGALLTPVSFSADGRRAAFALRKEGRLQLHVLSSEGADVQPIGAGLDVQGASSWSPDGNWIVVGGLSSQGQGLFKVPLDGGEIVRLVSGTAVNPVWSPDGGLIVYTGPNVGRDAPLLAVRPDGTQVEFPAINVRRDGRRARFLPNGKGLVYMQGPLASQDFWLLDLDTRRRRPLTHLTDPSAMLTFDVAPDGKSIVFDRVRENSDIVLIDLRH